MVTNLAADVTVIGGGPAGLAAAAEARKAGANRVVLLERHTEPGGVLQQCIHDGFAGLTGPEFAAGLLSEAVSAGVELLTSTIVTGITPGAGVEVVSPSGALKIAAPEVVLAMGCRERARGALRLPGTRPAGIFTAGTAQQLVNIGGVLPGHRAVVLGSGDIGLIMARRLMLEGVEVEGVYELLPELSGNLRNATTCLYDFGIPLHLSTTVVEVVGYPRLEGVWVAAVDQNRKPLPETRRYIPCDTLILSVGLIPENELSNSVGVKLDSRTRGPRVDAWMGTSIPGIRSCGNVAAVFDKVEDVVASARRAGEAAARRVESAPSCAVLQPGEGVSLVIPQVLNPKRLPDPVSVYLRVRRTMGPTRVNLTTGRGAILYSRRFPTARPPEMIALNLSISHLDGLEAGDVVSVNAVEEGRRE